MQKIRSAIKEHGLVICFVKLFDSVILRLSRAISTFSLKNRLDMLGCNYGKSLKADGRVVIRIDKRGAIKIGDNVKILSRFSSNLAGLTNPSVFVCCGSGRIEIGDNSGMSSPVFSSKSCIKIGKNVLIGANARIFDHDFHSVDYLKRRLGAGTGEDLTEPIFIGDDVFIGSNSIILKGVRIGDRSVIGAGAVVAAKEIPPDSLVIGNPARIVRTFNS